MAESRPRRVLAIWVGAARLEVHHRQHIRLADSPRDFADACLDLLAGEELRKRQAATVWEMVASNFSWEHVARCFERAIESQRAW